MEFSGYALQSICPLFTETQPCSWDIFTNLQITKYSVKSLRKLQINDQCVIDDEVHWSFDKQQKRLKLYLPSFFNHGLESACAFFLPAKTKRFETISLRLLPKIFFHVNCIIYGVCQNLNFLQHLHWVTLCGVFPLT